MSKWNDSSESDALEAVLAAAISSSSGSMVMPMACPICSQEALHVYFHSQGSDRLGGVWGWCSRCRHSSHGSIRPPAWWVNAKIVDLGTLTAHPESLEEVAEQLDEHWNVLRAAVP